MKGNEWIALLLAFLLAPIFVLAFIVWFVSVLHVVVAL